MGDPVGAARARPRDAGADGTWMIVEPFAGDRVEDNLNPVGRLFYAASTLLCTPASLSQDGRRRSAHRRVRRGSARSSRGRLHHFRRATETPTNLIFEARV